MSRVEENQKILNRIGKVTFTSGDMAMLASVLIDISQSLAVIADVQHEYLHPSIIWGGTEGVLAPKEKHTCGSCRYEYVPAFENPCIGCEYGEGRFDYWAPKEED